MTLTVSGIGTVTADGTEQVLATDTANGTYVTVVDLSNFAARTSSAAA
jgi:hypothetical protein